MTRTFAIALPLLLLCGSAWAMKGQKRRSGLSGVRAVKRTVQAEDARKFGGQVALLILDAAHEAAKSGLLGEMKRPLSDALRRTTGFKKGQYSQIIEKNGWIGLQLTFSKATISLTAMIAERRVPDARASMSSIKPVRDKMVIQVIEQGTKENRDTQVELTGQLFPADPKVKKTNGKYQESSKVMPVAHYEIPGAG